MLALRFDNWKVVFMEQRAQGTLQVWAEPFVPLRVPKLFNLRTDPFERADVTSNTYYDWFIDNAYLVLAAQTIVTREFLADVRGVPAAAEGGELHHRPGDGEARGDAHGGRTERWPTAALLERRRRRRRRSLDFVARVTDEGGRTSSPPPERVAVFDNDGTLWCEKPMPIQLGFILERLAGDGRGGRSRCATASRGRPPTSTTTHWLGAAMTKHYHGRRQRPASC